MAAKVFEKSAEETAFRTVLKEVYESGKNSVAVLWADAALSARFQETLYAFLLKDVLGSAAAGVKLRALCVFCGGEAETAQTEYTHETFIGLMSPITKGENKGAVRLDLFFKKGEAHFIPTLFAYVMNNILGDRFKKAVPDSLDRELEGEDGSMALGASLAGEENTERADDALLIQIAVLRRRLADADGFIGQRHVDRLRVRLGIHRGAHQTAAARHPRRTRL